MIDTTERTKSAIERGQSAADMVLKDLADLPDSGAYLAALAVCIRRLQGYQEFCLTITNDLLARVPMWTEEDE